MSVICACLFLAVFAAADETAPRATDTLILASGAKLVVTPFAVRPRPGGAEPIEIQPMGEGRRSIPGSDLRSVTFHEETVLQRVNDLLRTATIETLARAEETLTAAVRWHDQHRTAPPLTENPWRDLRARLTDRLIELRRDRLRAFVEAGDMKAAVAAADRWRPLYPPGSPLRDAIRTVWVQQAAMAVQAKDYHAARTGLDRIDREFSLSSDADDLRKTLRARAEVLVADAGKQPASQALRTLQEALVLWPRLPGARDALERHRQSYQILRVGVRTLPEALSPATAWTDVEKQTLDLVFEGLLRADDQPSAGATYRPALAERVPIDMGLRRRVTLRRDLFWSDGTRLSAADIRHTALLASQSGGGAAVAWRELLDAPRIEGDGFHFEIRARQGYFAPLALLTFPVLPQQFAGQPLQRAADPAFARAPLGSGPYQYVGTRSEKDQPTAIFHANPYHVRAGRLAPGDIREIHLVAQTAKEVPHLLWDVATDQLAAARKQGFTDLQTLTTPRVHILAMNQRRPSLSKEAHRRALGLAVDRRTLLDRHFRGALPPAPTPGVLGPVSVLMQPKASPAASAFHHLANGPFPAGSWALAPATRVPDDPYDAERARALLRPLQTQLNGTNLTLKYPDDDPRLRAVCANIAGQYEAVFTAAGLKATVRPIALSPRELKAALDRRDYDLLYMTLDHADDPVRLQALFDPDGLEAGGSNFLGVDSDAKLQSLLRSALRHRDFPAVREVMQNIHVHLYETAPLIPLWQLDTHVALRPGLQVPGLAPLSLFGNVLEWKLAP